MSRVDDASHWQNIALDSIGEGNKESYREHMKRKRLAFEHLKPLCDNLPNDFYRDYYTRIKKGLKANTYSDDLAMIELDRYMNSEIGKAEKYRFLRSLTIAQSEGACDVSVFNDFGSSDWGWVMLLRALVPLNDSWNVEKSRQLAREIVKLDRFMKENTARHCLEDVLEILIAMQRTYQLDVEFMIKTAELLRVNVQSLDVIFRDSASSKLIMEQLESLRLREICNQQGILYAEESQIVELLRLLPYSDETVDDMLGKVKPGTEITELIDLFKTLNDTELPDKEDFLVNLRSHGIIDIWKCELYFPLIRAFICREFPAYDDWSTRVETPEARRLVDANYNSTANYKSAASYTKYVEFDERGREKLKRALRGNSAEEGLLRARLFFELNHQLATLLFKRGWSDKTLKIIEQWIKCFDDERKLAELVEVLAMILEYDIDITESKLSTLISQSTLANVQKEVHKFIIDNSFPESCEKTLDQLINELIALNANDECVSLLKQKNLIRGKYNQVVAAYNGTSNVSSSTKKIKDWTDSEILDWSKTFFINKLMGMSDLVKLGYPAALVASLTGLSPDVKMEFTNQVRKTSQHEITAVVTRAMELTSRLKIRDIQLLSMILLLNTEDRTGRLAQVNTGEGKTMIIAMIAAYHAIKGHKVDVITSSKLLAIPQCLQHQGFFQSLCLLAAHNFGSDDAYKADIVYGTSQEFQGDILRDEFKKQGNRHGRKCDVVIVDEVDNMLVDGNSHIVMLSTDMPGMDHLEPLLASIYTQIKNAAASTVVDEGQAYFVYQDNALDENGHVNEQVEMHMVPIEGTRKEFIETSTERHIRRLIRDPNADEVDKDFPEIKIPKHLRELISKCLLKKFIYTALAAQFIYRQDEEYVIEDDEIKVVDADNTGVVQLNMQLSDGLHQFLQTANGLRMTPERLTTNFLSNVGFFRRYRPRIYGLTGTLGSEATKKLLAKTYDVDTVVVPSFKLKRAKELSPIVVEDEHAWYSAIARSCLRKLRNGRACLVIMEYIRETDLLKEMFVNKFSYNANNIMMYKTNKDAEIVERTLRSGEIIITTNIAGRGTDIRLSDDIDARGGLHVCVTFLPKNSRVEEQNVGRTARTGNRGTSQLVLRNSETDIGELRRERKRKDDEAMRDAEKEIARVTTQDMIFQKFCHLTDVINELNKEITRDIEKKAVEERFAIWLKMNGDKWEDRGADEARKNFQTFEANIRRDQEGSKLIENPYMHVLIGNKYLLDKKDYSSAIAEYKKAIRLDKNFAEHAYYNMGYALIAQYGNNVSGNKSFIDEAVDSFKKARDLVYQREYGLHFVNAASDGKLFGAKIRNKLNLYNLQKNTIDLAIGPDLVAIEAQLEQLKRNRDSGVKSGKLTPEEVEEVETSINDLEDVKKNEGVINAARRKGKDVSIEVRKLAECLPEDEKKYDKEIEEFEGNGAIGAFTIAEIPPIDWSAVFALLALGLGQMILGGALMVFTLGGGATIATGLIAEGIKDIITAVKDGIINRSFSWASWAIEKAISLVVSVACAGWAAMKDCAKTMYAGAKAATSLFTRAATQAMKEGWKIVAKKIGQEFAKKIGKELASGLINYTIDKTLMPAIQQIIVEAIKEPITRALLDNDHVKTMLQLDQLNGNHHYENRIRAIGHEILQSAKKNKDLMYICQKIATGIADKKIKRFETSRKVSGAIAAVPELVTFTDKFIVKLNESIAKEAKKDNIDEKLSIMLKNIEEEKTKKSDENNHSTPRKEELPKKSNPAGIAKEFVKTVSSKMINIIQGKITGPLVDEAVKFTSDNITKDMDKAMNDQMRDYRNRERIIIRD